MVPPFGLRLLLSSRPIRAKLFELLGRPDSPMYLQTTRCWRLGATLHVSLQMVRDHEPQVVETRRRSR